MATAAWRSAYLADPGLGEVAFGTWVDLAILHGWLLALLAMRSSSLAWGFRPCAILGAATLLVSAAVRIFDLGYFFYSGTHLDQRLFAHAEGFAWDVTLGPQVIEIMLIGTLSTVTALVLFTLFVRGVARADRHRLTRCRAVLVASLGLTSAASVALCMGRGESDRRPGEVHADWPELVVLRLLLEDDGVSTSTTLSPVVQHKLRAFGYDIDPAARYPLRRDKLFDAPPAFARTPEFCEHPNVIVLFFESFSAALTSVYNPEQFPGLTPNLEDFAAKSHVVHDVYNSSTPTLPGIAASLSSMTLGGVLQLRFELPQRGVASLPSVLADHGYHTVYAFQVPKTFIGTGRLMQHLGVAETLDAVDVGRELKEQRRSWGYSDRQMFRFLTRRLQRDGVSEPFFFAMSTLDSHPPFRHASDGIEYGDGEHPLLNSVHSADAAFGIFWRAFQESRYRDRTIVIVLADHPMIPGTEYREVRKPVDVTGMAFDKIPLIIYDPTRELVGSSRVLSTQVDLAPTTLHLLGINPPSPFEGHSVFDQGRSQQAVLGFTGSMFFSAETIDGEVVVDQFLIDDIDDRGPDPRRGELTRHELVHFAEWKRALLAADRLWPHRTTEPALPARQELDIGKIQQWIRQLDSSAIEEQIVAAGALTSFGPTARAAVPPLTKLLSSDDDSVRATAAQALSAIDEDGISVPALRSAHQRSSGHARAEAVLALAKIAPQDPAIDAEIRPDLAAAERLVRVAAVHGLLRIDPTSGQACEVLARALMEGDPILGRAAAEALADLGPAALPAGAAISQATLATDNLSMVFSSVAALGEIGSQATPHLVSLLRHSDPFARVATLIALGNIGPPAIGALPHLVAAAGDEHTLVRRGAAQALLFVAPNLPESSAAVRTLLEDADVEVRGATAYALRQSCGLLDYEVASSFLPVLREMLDDPTEREAALITIEKIERRRRM